MEAPEREAFDRGAGIDQCQRGGEIAHQEKCSTGRLALLRPRRGHRGDRDHAHLGIRGRGGEQVTLPSVGGRGVVHDPDALRAHALAPCHHHLTVDETVVDALEQPAHTGAP